MDQQVGREQGRRHRAVARENHSVGEHRRPESQCDDEDLAGSGVGDDAHAERGDEEVEEEQRHDCPAEPADPDDLSLRGCALERRVETVVHEVGGDAQERHPGRLTRVHPAIVGRLVVDVPPFVDDLVDRERAVLDDAPGHVDPDVLVRVVEVVEVGRGIEVGDDHGDRDDEPTGPSYRERAEHQSPPVAATVARSQQRWRTPGRRADTLSSTGPSKSSGISKCRGVRPRRL